MTTDPANMIVYPDHIPIRWSVLYSPMWNRHVQRPRIYNCWENHWPDWWGQWARSVSQHGKQKQQRQHHPDYRHY